MGKTKYKINSKLTTGHLEDWSDAYAELTEGNSPSLIKHRGFVVRAALEAGWLGEAVERDEANSIVREMPPDESTRLATSINKRYAELTTIDPN